MTPWSELTFGEAELGEALHALARAARLDPRPVATPESPRAGCAQRAELDAWLEIAAESIGVEAEPVECGYAELAEMLRSFAPALVRLTLHAQPRYLAVVSSERRTLRVLTPPLTEARIATAELRDALTAAIEEVPRRRVDAWLSRAGLPPRAARRARSALLHAVMSDRRIGDIWLLRADPGTSFRHQLRLQGVPRRAMLFACMTLAQVVATVGAWIMLGNGALAGSVERGWLAAWLLACFCAIWFQVAGSWLGGRLTAEIGALLKRRLLCGALRLDPDAIRTRGSGRLLAMVSESEAVEGAGLSHALNCALGAVQLCSAAVVLTLGAGGLLHLALLGLWTALLVGLATRFFRQRMRWTAERFTLANSFVENVVGNRTRIAQQPRRLWHRREDEQLERYLHASRAMDRAQASLGVLPARGFAVLGFLGLIPAVLFQDTGQVPLAIAIGGILQAQAGFSALAMSATPISAALVAWRQIAELYHAAARLPLPGNPGASSPGRRAGGADSVVLAARGVSFRYRTSARPVLQDCAVTLRRGDRVLLEGPSGGGKSTLAALLLGLHTPESGHILLHGLDRPTLGSAAWRRLIASAPQFHENHVLSASLAFNLLMGRSWPPSRQDLQRAEQLCRQLGLGRMIDRMPSGLHQVIGETGWQLSHGERSRVFLARALLQDADVLVLDECFGALDPDTLALCLDTVVAHAPALIVIAHP